MANHQGLDLQTLHCLEVLVAERHVTRAAERLGMTQPKLSALLGRLRDEFSDPLLVRTAQGMVPTECAIELAALARDLSRRLDYITAPRRRFEPGSTEAAFTMSLSDSLARFVLPPLLRLLRGEAPNVRLVTRPPDPARLRPSLEDGSCDLAVGYWPDLPEALYSSGLFNQHLCCIVSARHAHQADPLSLEQYVALKHVVFASGYSPLVTLEHLIDEELARRGLERSVSLHVASLLAIPAVVAETDLIATVPLRVARDASERLPLSILEPPINLSAPQISMVWHERSQHDAAHKWLRKCLRRATEAF